MSDWICIAEPELVLIRAGAFQCPHCHRAVIAFSDDDIEKQPRIKSYTFCPYCGERNIKDDYYLADSGYPRKWELTVKNEERDRLFSR